MNLQDEEKKKKDLKVIAPWKDPALSILKCHERSYMTQCNMMIRVRPRAPMAAKVWHHVPWGLRTKPILHGNQGVGPCAMVVKGEPMRHGSQCRGN